MSGRVTLTEVNESIKRVDGDPALQALVAYVVAHPVVVIPVANRLAKMKKVADFRTMWKSLSSFSGLSQPHRSHVNNLQRLVSALYTSASKQRGIQPDAYLGDLRGRFGELVVREYLRARYRRLVGGKTMDNAAVTIEGVPVVYEHKRSIDVAATADDPEEGTFFEVKVSPKSFDADDCKLLALVRLECDKAKYNAVVGGFTLHSRASIMILREDLPRNYPNLAWRGAEDLEALSDVG